MSYGHDALIAAGVWSREAAWGFWQLTSGLVTPRLCAAWPDVYRAPGDVQAGLRVFAEIAWKKLAAG